MDVLRLGQAAYPRLLKEIHNPPDVLYTQGDLVKRLNEPGVKTVAIVGSRRSTPYGRRWASQLAEELSRLGVLIISGMAQGIDAAAHAGALKGPGKTIGVLGCGLDITYPIVNTQLYACVRAEGGLISEYPEGTPALAAHFPARNRIISGLSQAVVVVEGRAKSGALITADFALEQGREVLAVPGPIDSPFSEAPHKLIQSGAKLVRGVLDILEEIGLAGEGVASHSKPPMPHLSEEEKQVYEAVAGQPLNIDEIIRKTGLQTHTISSILVVLELKNLIMRGLDGNYIVCS